MAAYAALLSLAHTTDLTRTLYESDFFTADAVEKLRSIHDFVNILLSSFKESPEKVNRCESRIRNVAGDAEDIIEVFVSLQIQSRRYSKMYLSSVDLEDQLQEIIFKIGSIVGEVMEKRPAIQLPSSSSSSTLAAAAGKDAVIGLEDDITAIKDRLCRQSSERQVIPIVGMGGIGKSTLARTLYDDRCIVEIFRIRAWVVVSKDYDPHRFWTVLLDSMRLLEKEQTSGDEMNHSDIGLKVYQKLKGRRYLIVMDDVWNTTVWDDVMNMFPDDNNGSRIMLTTRQSDVAAYHNPDSPRIHEMHFMNDAQSWDLLKHKVFGSRDCPSELEEVGKGIARRCAGLPLSVVLVAGVLSSVDKTLDSWKEIAKDVNLVGRDIEEILSLSYTYLPHHLRPCFLFIGYFVEDVNIRSSRLVKLWVAEGFVKHKNVGNKILEEEAEEYLMDLVKRNLVIVTSRNINEKIKSCSLHDMVRGLCVSKAREENFLHARDGRDLPLSNKRRIIFSHSDRSTISGEAFLSILGSQDIPSLLRSFKLLRELDALAVNLKELPSEAFELYDLRYLVVMGSFSIPSLVHNLVNLQTLIVHLASGKLQRSYIDGVPHHSLPLEIWRMPQLRHLFFHAPYILPHPREGIFDYVPLENLQTLLLVRDLVWNEKIIRMIPNVKRLELAYTTGQKYCLNHLKDLHQLEKLKVIGCLRFLWRDQNPIFPCTLKKLSLVGGGFRWKDMAVVGLLPRLQVLKLLDYACDGDTWETSDKEFPVLHVLHIEESFLQFWITESNHFPTLKHLILRSCRLLMEIPEAIGEIPTLEVIEVDSCTNHLVESAKKIKEDQEESSGNDAFQVHAIHERLDFGEPVPDARGETLLINEMVGKDFNENLERIWNLLEDRQVSMIGVCGMGGVGKTRLAKHVYNRLVQEYDGRVVWVTVSQEFTIKSLQDKIARFLGVKLDGEDEEATRAARLHRFLSEEKISVLILDDVWENIDMERVGCNFAMECCRLIVTTRSAEVCHGIGCNLLISVVKLGKDEAWKLFTVTLGKESVLGPQVEEVAKSMVKVCDGLPLGIITVAGSMKGKTAIHTWRNAATQLKECVAGRQNNMGEVDEVFKVLKYSFDQLKRNDERERNEPNMFQLCFLYCSLYPEDYEIERDHLVRKFISEGLLDERSRRSQGDQGHSILDRLVNLCLLEKSCVRRAFSGESKESVKMHNLVRSMALKICKGKYMVRAGEWSLKEIPNQEEWTEDLEKVSLVHCKIESIGEGVSPDCPKLSTLLLWGNEELKFIPDSFFSKMQGLCTLDLCGNQQITMLPNSVSELRSLKSLLLEYCRKLTTVPNLGRLKALRVLNLSRTGILKIPQGLEKLGRLRFFSVNVDGFLWFRGGFLLELGHLEHLNLPFHLQVEIEEMENLKQLEVFSGGVKNVSDFNWFITNHATCCYSIVVGSDTPEWKLEDLGCKNNKLVLYESNLRDEKLLGKDISHLEMMNCEGLSKCFVDDLASRFGNPTSLKTLRIEYCGGIECIWRSDLHGVGLQISETLEEIELEDLDDVKEVVMMQRGEMGASTSAPAQLLIFSSLKVLRIERCHKIRKVGFPVSGLPNLEGIDITRCEKIEEIFEEEDEGRNVVATLPKLRWLYLSGNPRLRKVGLAASGVPNLENIHIESCGGVEEIFKEEDEGRDVIATLPKLEVLVLKGNPRLRKVEVAASGVPNLKNIHIELCGEIEEIFKEEDEGRDVVATLPKLEVLWLKGNPRLTKVGVAASGVPNLKRIHIMDSTEIEEILKEEDEGRDVVATLLKLEVLRLKGNPRLRKVGLAASRVPNLERIDIKNCEEIEEIFKEEDEGRDVVATLPKLVVLWLKGNPRLRKVGVAASGVPNLGDIHIDSCGEIEEIFKEEDEGRDVVATLPKLEVLVLKGNQRLRKVGLAESGVPNLKHIEIKSCGEIEEIFKEEYEGRVSSVVTTLHKLKVLELSGNPKLRRVAASRFPNVERIRIWDCGEIEEIFKE